MSGIRTGQANRSVCEDFEEQALRTPHAIALRFDSREVNYAELNQQANALAHRLLSLGAGSGAFIAIGVDPGPDTAVAILGVLKAGAAYVPVSTGDPVDRVAYQLQDTGAKALLTQSRHLERFGSLCPHSLTVADAAQSADRSAIGNPEIPADPDRTAYVLYTSGSSGHPKGVAVSHRSLAYYVHWHRDHLFVESGQLDLPLSSSVCFAAGVTQLYAPLVLGRTLHILSRETVKNPEDLFGWYRDHPQHGLYCVPTLWSELIRFAEASAESSSSLAPPRGVFLSGEAVAESLVARSFAAFPETRLWNLYGPTETVANASFTELKAGRPVTIGQAIAGTEIHLLDGQSRPVRAGEPGEICIFGDGVASGYVNLPQATQERFVVNPLVPDSGQRLFKTGDLARRNDSGDLMFIGRRDFQIQVRGHRVECGEIEATLAQHPAVREAVAVGIRQDGLDRTLVAYVTFRLARYATVDDLRAFLADRLPDYMIPRSFVMLEEFPKLANGKIDRAHLPPPGRSRPDLTYKFVPPTSVREKKLVRVWEEVLGVEGVGVQDDFFDLGGDSLSIAAALARVGEAQRVAVSYAEFFGHPTPATLSEFLGKKEPMPDAVPQSIQRLDQSASDPSSQNQRGLWVLTQTFPNQTAYNIQFSVTFDGVLDHSDVAAALAALLRRHDSLRTVITQEHGHPMARVQEFTEPQIDAVDLRNLESAQADLEADRLTAAQAARPFDLAQGPLYRFTLVRLGEQRHRLLVTVHHIVFDGRSIHVFCRGLVDHYRRIQAGTPEPDGADEIQYRDWSAWREGPGADGDGAALGYWRDALSGGAPVINFPTDFARPPMRGFDGSVRSLPISESLKARLGRFNRGRQTTAFMTLLAVFKVLLFRYSGQDDILVGTPVANRRHSQAETLIGFLANTIVLRSTLAMDRKFGELLADVRETCLGAMEHQSFPFDQLVDVLGPERSLTHTPVFQVMFALHEKLGQAQIGDHLKVSAREDGNSGAKYDLVLDVQDQDEGMELRLSYRTDLFAGATIERFLQQFVQVLAEALDHPDRALADLAISPQDDLERIQVWNDTAHENERDLGLARLFQSQAARTPDATAVVAGQDQLTFGELDGRSNGVAHLLIENGVKQGGPVGVHLEPSAQMVIVLLGVLKAGAAYVPLDPYYPRQRIDAIIEDAGLDLIVTSQGLSERLGSVSPGLLFVEDAGVVPDKPPLNFTHDPSDLMYLMYTSGSAGTPKGVRVPHVGPSNFVLWMRDRFPLSADDAVLMRTSINFDISVWEMFLPLITGARLVVGLREELQAPESLAALIQRQNITHIQFVPSALRGFVDSGVLPSCRSLQRIFSGGEALPTALQNDVFTAYGGELHNLYGPTEASVYVCHWQCRRNERLRGVPIGKPIHNTQVHILDEHMGPAPIGLTGQVYLGGECVTLGYHRKPEQTAAAFVQDPFTQDPQARLFKTGDQARYLPTGDIEFLGRLDRQVKVRGYRVELGEIEHHLGRHPNVKHAIIIVREDEPDDFRLVAYLLYEDQSGPDAAELRTYLRQKLPDYMIPAHFVTLDSIPLLPNSKADVAGLPKPEYQKTLRSELDRNYASEHECGLAAIWEEVLETGRFGPEDSFFDVGGHSLVMARLSGLIEQRLGVRVSNIDLFQFPTIRSLARHLSRTDDVTGRIAAEMARRQTLRKRRNSSAHRSSKLRET